MTYAVGGSLARLGKVERASEPDQRQREHVERIDRHGTYPTVSDSFHGFNLRVNLC